MVQRPVIQRRRDDAGVYDIHAGARQSVTERVAQRGSTRPVVAADDDGTTDLVRREVLRVCVADGARRFLGQILADDASDVVLAKNPCGDGHAVIPVSYTHLT